MDYVEIAPGVLFNLAVLQPKRGAPGAPEQQARLAAQDSAVPRRNPAQADDSASADNQLPLL